VNLYIKPAALEALASLDQVVAAVKSENQELPMGSLARATGNRGADQRRLNGLKTPTSSSRERTARRSSCGKWPTCHGPQELTALALYNGQRTVLQSCFTCDSHRQQHGALPVVEREAVEFLRAVDHVGHCHSLIGAPFFRDRRCRGKSSAASIAR